MVTYQFIIPASMVVLYFGLWLLIRTMGKQSRAGNVFNLVVASLGLWSLGVAMFYKSSTPGASLFWAQVIYFGGSLIPASFFLFSFIFSQGEFSISQRKQFLIYLPNIILFYLLFFTPSIIKEAALIHGGKGIKYGPAVIVWLFQFSTFFFLAFVRLIRMYLHSKGRVRNQLSMIIWGALLGLLLAGVTNVVMPLVNRFELFWLGPSLTMVFAGFVAYAIFKYNFIDIQIIIKRSLIYSILVAVITVLYLLLVTGCQYLSQNLFGRQGVVGTTLITLIVAAIFAPLKNRIQDFVDKTFFKRSVFDIEQENEMLKQEVEQSERYKTLADLTSGIVDEIRNPLTSLKGYTHFFDQRRDDREFMDKFSSVLKRDLDKINDLIEHLTAYGSPGTLAAQETDMTKLLMETVGMLKSRMIEGKIELKKELSAGEGLKLQVDPSQIRQAVSAIVLNALEAMPNGGTLRLLTEVSGGTYRIRVQDKGVGIPKESMNKIFDPFYSTKGRSGLGLSIAQGIIRNHGGRIRVKSQEGLGSELIIDLPLPDLSSQGGGRPS